MRSLTLILFLILAQPAFADEPGDCMDHHREQISRFVESMLQGDPPSNYDNLDQFVTKASIISREIIELVGCPREER